MNTKEIFEDIQGRISGVVSIEEPEIGDPWIQIDPAQWHDVALFLRDDEKLRFNMCLLVTGLDWPDEKWTVVYHLHSQEHNQRVTIKVDLPRTEPIVDSVHDVWSAANWHERETFDLMGIEFRGHPNPTRILCPDDWVGHPLRKDYEFPTEYRGIPYERNEKI
ncbi:MAG: NADH-quinone oxidoreductase subunit C [Planctomycetota bacterium]